MKVISYNKRLHIAYQIKQFCTVLFILISSIIYSQDYSIINFISISEDVEIFVNKNRIGKVSPNECLQYKTFSMGIWKIDLVGNGFNNSNEIDVKAGNTYFIETPSAKLLSESKGIRLKTRTTIIAKDERVDSSLNNFNLNIVQEKEDFSVINFVTNNSINRNYTIYINDRLIGSINKNENLEYIIYSQGEVNIKVISNSNKYTDLVQTDHINLRTGETHNYLLGSTESLLEKTKDIAGMKLYEKKLSTRKVQENKGDPIIIEKVH
jgi:hypothetical protein